MFAYDTLLRYAINSTASALAVKFGVDAATRDQGANMTYAAIMAAIALGTWAWGLYRSTRKQKMLDVAQSPDTLPSVKNAIVSANPGLVKEK